jgi:hypothetical protein
VCFMGIRSRGMGKRVLNRVTMPFGGRGDWDLSL